MVEKDVLRQLNEHVTRLEEHIKKLEETIAWQEMEINRLRNEVISGNTKTFLRETSPVWKAPMKINCGECGISLDGPLGYVCNNPTCPSKAYGL